MAEVMPGDRAVPSACPCVPARSPFHFSCPTSLLWLRAPTQHRSRVRHCRLLARRQPQPGTARHGHGTPRHGTGVPVPTPVALGSTGWAQGRGDSEEAAAPHYWGVCGGKNPTGDLRQGDPGLEREQCPGPGPPSPPRSPEPRQPPPRRRGCRSGLGTGTPGTALGPSPRTRGSYRLHRARSGRSPPPLPGGSGPVSPLHSPTRFPRTSRPIPTRFPRRTRPGYRIPNLARASPPQLPG